MLVLACSRLPFSLHHFCVSMSFLNSFCSSLSCLSGFDRVLIGFLIDHWRVLLTLFRCFVSCFESFSKASFHPPKAYLVLCFLQYHLVALEQGFGRAGPSPFPSQKRTTVAALLFVSWCCFYLLLLLLLLLLLCFVCYFSHCFCVCSLFILFQLLILFLLFLFLLISFLFSSSSLLLLLLLCCCCSSSASSCYSSCWWDWGNIVFIVFVKKNHRRQNRLQNRICGELATANTKKIELPPFVPST